jgi:hypothetical protein
MAHVKGPNGQVLEFPDDIAAALAKQDDIEIVDEKRTRATKE